MKTCYIPEFRVYRLSLSMLEHAGYDDPKEGHESI